MGAKGRMWTVLGVRSCLQPGEDGEGALSLDLNGGIVRWEVVLKVRGEGIPGGERPQHSELAGEEEGRGGGEVWLTRAGWWMK